MSTIAAFLMLQAVSGWSFGAQLPRKMLASYGYCTAEKYPSLSRRYVMKAGEGWQSPAPYLQLGNSGCADGPVRFEPMIMAYILSDGLLLRDGILDKVIYFADVSALDHVRPTGKHDKDVKFAEVSRFGECVVRGQPGVSWELLKQPVESVAEERAMASLAMVMSQCDAGYSAKFNATVIRGAIAMAYYRMAASQARAAGTN